MSEENSEQKDNSEIANSDSLLSEFTALEIEETMNRFVEVFGKDGELLEIGFQNDEAFLDTFGSQYS